MLKSFDECLSFVLNVEGGYVNDPRDPGGETKFGISKRAYPDVDIPNLTFLDASKIYKKDYWDFAKLDYLPEKIRLIMFDGAVNHGPSLMVKALQKFLRVPQDGIVGSLTISWARDCDARGCFYFLHTFRTKIYINNRNWGIYGNGWMKRINLVESVTFLK